MISEPYVKSKKPKEADVPWFALKILVVVGVLLIAIVTMPSEREIRRNNSTQTDQSVINTVPTTELDLPIVAETRADKRAKKADEISLSGLKAQWVMADIAWMGMFIGGIGIAYIAWTLRETREAAKSASKALGVAQDTFEFEKKSRRPWINISDVKIIKISPEEIDPNNTYMSISGGPLDTGIPVGSDFRRVEVQVSFENVGSSPAINAVCLAGILLKEPFFRRLDDMNPRSQFAGSYAKHSLGVGSSKTVTPNNMILAGIDLLVPADDYQILFVQVFYRGVDGRPYLSYTSFDLSNEAPIIPDHFFNLRTFVSPDTLGMKDKLSGMI